MKQQITKNKFIWLLVVLFGLIMLNIWRWWPIDDGNKNHRNPANTGVAFEELLVAVPENTLRHEKGIERDLFHLQLPKKVVSVKQAQPIKKPKKALPSPEELAKHEAEAGLASIKLIATARRNGKNQAYIAMGESSSVVTEGMNFAEEYTVIKIYGNSIFINHNNTGIQKEITLSE